MARCYEIFSRLGFELARRLQCYSGGALRDYAVVQSVEELDALAQIREAGLVSIGVVSTGESNFRATSSVCRFRRRLRLRDTSHWDTLV